MSVKARWEGLKDWEMNERQYYEEIVGKVWNELEQTAFRIERYSKLLVPIDTGDLRRSISKESKRSGSRLRAEVGTDMHYAEVVEFGGKNQRAQPYLIPAFDDSVKGLESAINEVLRG